MNIIKRMPLSDSQMGMYLDFCDRKETLAYNITFEYKFDSSVDPERLRNAADTVFASHEAFSCCIFDESGIPELAVSDERPACGLHYVKKEEYEKTKSCFACPFEFGESLLCRASVFATGENVYLLTDIHHMIFDGMSSLIFEKELESAYRGETVQMEKVSFSDASERENEVLSDDSEEYFDRLLGGVEADSNILPDKDEKESGKCSMFHYNPNLTREEVRDFAGRTGVSENIVFLTAFAYALSKYTSQSDALFTSVSSGRYNRGIDDTIGFFVRTFPLYFSFDEEIRADELLRSVKDIYKKALLHDGESFPELCGKYGIRSDIKYVYQGDILKDFLFDGKQAEKTLFDCDDALSNFNIMISPKDEGYSFRFDYRNSLYTEGNIKCFASFFTSVIKGLLENRCLKDISLIDSDGIGFIGRFNDTGYEYDREETVFDVIYKRVKESPDAVAVSYKDRKITYSELDLITSSLASFLSEKGTGKDEFVSVLTGRNEYAVLCPLAIVRAGAAYQPLDPKYPKERLNFMIRDSRSRFLIADRELMPLLDGYEGEVIFTDEIESLTRREGFEPLDRPDSALIIIYTSGTTGTPKGCILENRNVTCFYHNHKRNIGLEKTSRVANYASFGFDAGVMDVFTTIMAGAALYIIPEEIRLDISLMDKFYIENGITHGFMTTQLGAMFAQITACSTIKSFMVGGEKLTPFQPSGKFDFFNGYGPSETLAYICFHKVTDGSAVQPIGKTSGNTKLYVVDKYSRLLPPGVCGELCISGGQVGRGYLGRDDVTSRVFVENPFSEDGYYSRMYKTGDIVRLLPSGELDFVGRRDGQVKIRGFRIELTEVEKIIREFRSVKNAACVAYDSPSGGKAITGYIVSDEKIDVKELASFIRESKPDYMVPEHIMQIDEIPLNVNGKVDRRKLPLPSSENGNFKKPSTPVQKRVFGIVSSVIGNDAFGTDSDLFASGLSSIGVIKLNVLLSDEFGMSFSLQDIHANSTVEGIEKLILAGRTVSEKEIKDIYPLSKTQEGIYIECLMNQDSVNYNIPLLLKIDASVDEKRLREAIVSAVNAHRCLLTHIVLGINGEACQTVPEGEMFEVSDIEYKEASSIEEIKDTLVRPYNIHKDRLFRISIIDAGRLYLFIDVHHIIFDGTSMNILMTDIEKAYFGEEIASESFSSFDVAENEAELRKGEMLEKAKDYYFSLFSGRETDFLPLCDIVSEKEKGTGEYIALSDDNTAEKAEKFCLECNASVNGLLLASFGYALAKLSGTDKTVFTTVYSGRNDSRVGRTVSMLVKTLPVSVDLTTAGTPSELSEILSKQYLDSMMNDTYSFAEISRDLSVKNDIMFIYQGENFVFDTFLGCSSEEVPLNISDKKAPIAVQVFKEGGRFRIRTDYDKDMFSEKLIKTLIGSFERTVNEFFTSKSLSSVPDFISETGLSVAPFRKERTIAKTHVSEESSRKKTEPAGRDEKEFCRIFEEVLGLKKVYADDDFFEIGGTSISAAQAVVKCGNAGYEIVFKNFFENSTPKALASFVSGNKQKDILSSDDGEKYDCSCLDYNVIGNLPNIKYTDIGDVLLTGVTGFLGSHIYKKIMETTDKKVICPIRSKNGMSSFDRLEMTMIYYFEDWFRDEYAERTTVIDTDLESDGAMEKLLECRFDTIINTAANVKHFDKSENLIRDNYTSVENLISLAEKSKAVLIQASSLSVCGESVNGSIPSDFRFRENNLDIGQSLENKYVYSKYLAERAIIDAVSRGRIRGKIIRLGNLAARNSDGEFQINVSNNALMEMMKGYVSLGCYPVDMLDAEIEFSPIDKVAEAMLLLSGTPDEFTVFHCKNCHTIHYGYFIKALIEKGYDIKIVEQAEFEERFKEALKSGKDVSSYTAFIAYLNRTDESASDSMKYNDDMSNDAGEAEKNEYETRVKVASDTAFTTKALYRLGFSWPLISSEYFEGMVRMLDDRNYFLSEK